MKRRHHPIMGFFAGLFLGLGAALILFVFGVIPLTVVWLVSLVVGGIVIGIVLGYLLPSRRGKNPPAPEGIAPATA